MGRLWGRGEFISWRIAEADLTRTHDSVEVKVIVLSN
jgi:hypothetical protein